MPYQGASMVALAPVERAVVEVPFLLVVLAVVLLTPMKVAG